MELQTSMASIFAPASILKLLILLSQVVEENRLVLEQFACDIGPVQLSNSYQCWTMWTQSYERGSCHGIQYR